MATLREIKRRIGSVKSTQQITKAMKMVAAAHLRKAQERVLSTRPYSEKIGQMVEHISGKLENPQDPLLISRDVRKVLVVVIAADRGLCGGFNGNTIKKALSVIDSHKENEVEILAVGKKAYEYFSKRDYTVYSFKKDFFNHLVYSDAIEIAEKLKYAFLNDGFDKIEIVYNQFKSAIRQILTVEQFLPLKRSEEEIESLHGVDYLYEPSKEDILSLLIPKHLNVQMWKILLESNASEQGARMTAMENATDNAQDLIERLTLTYNRARQSAITTELVEIVSGAEALKEN